LRCHAVPEIELIMYPSMSSASPALSQYIGNSLVDYTFTSEGHERNATDIVAVVHQTIPSMYNTMYKLQKCLIKNSENYIILLLYFSFFIILETKVPYL
jgi:hypothetical protein